MTVNVTETLAMPCVSAVHYHSLSYLELSVRVSRPTYRHKTHELRCYVGTPTVVSQSNTFTVFNIHCLNSLPGGHVILAARV